MHKQQATRGRIEHKLTENTSNYEVTKRSSTMDWQKAKISLIINSYFIRDREADDNQDRSKDPERRVHKLLHILFYYLNKVRKYLRN